MKNKVKEFLLLIRFQYFITSLLPMFLVFTVILSRTEFNLQLLVKLMLVSIIILLLHTAANLVNDYYDSRKGCDLQENGNDQQLQIVKKVYIACYLILIPVSLILSYYSGWLVLLPVLLGVLGSYLYTATPWSMKYHALGEAANLFFLGPAIFASVEYALIGKVSIEVILLSMIMGLLITTILTTNNLRDISHDKAAGIKTMVTIIGYRSGTMLLVLEIAAAFLIILAAILLRFLPGTTALVLVWLPAYIFNWLQIARSTARTENVMKMVKLYTLSGMTLLISLLPISF